MGVENRRMKTSRDDDGEKEKDERMGAGRVYVYGLTRSVRSQIDPKTRVLLLR